MYERFTDRARKVMQLANVEAQRLRQDYIGSEHILLGIIAEGSGVAANVLKNLHVHRGNLRADVERLIQEGSLPLGSRGKKIIESAMMEARRLGHNYVGTEHLLLGLLEDKEGVAGKALEEQGLTPDGACQEILDLLVRGFRPSPTPAERVAEVEDLPEPLQARVADLDGEIRRFTHEKEEAVANQDFETAARFRDEADKRHRQRRTLVREWFASRVADPSWLTANDGAARKLAENIRQSQSWDLLPDLADALELAGCSDLEIINHCYSGAKHSTQCWVVELLLYSAPAGEP